MNPMTIFIPGIPQPKGSWKPLFIGGRARLVPDCKKSKPWQKKVAAACANVMARPFTSAVSLTVAFIVPRPASHVRKQNGEWRKGVPLEPTRKPDIDKLLRTVLDALTGVAYVDDSQVVVCKAIKQYAGDEGPGVRIRVEELA